MLLIIPLLGSAVAQMQQQFIAPPLLRDPLYDIKWLETPLDVSQYASDQIVSIFDGHQHVQCILPEEQDRGSNFTHLEPIENPEIIAAAREILSNLEDSDMSSMEDVWQWRTSFDSKLLQVLQTRGEDPHSGQSSAQLIAILIGEKGPIDGTNLGTATPVVVNDKHMMMTVFFGGSLCDLTKAPRTTRVFFTCDVEATESPILQSAHEPYPCFYELVVGVSQLCTIPEFRYSQIEPNYIVCGPVSEE